MRFTGTAYDSVPVSIWVGGQSLANSTIQGDKQNGNVFDVTLSVTRSQSFFPGKTYVVYRGIEIVASGVFPVEMPPGGVNMTIPGNVGLRDKDGDGINDISDPQPDVPNTESPALPSPTPQPRATPVASPTPVAPSSGTSTGGTSEVVGNRNEPTAPNTDTPYAQGIYPGGNPTTLNKDDVYSAMKRAFEDATGNTQTLAPVAVAQTQSNPEDAGKLSLSVAALMQSIDDLKGVVNTVVARLQIPQPKAPDSAPPVSFTLMNQEFSIDLSQIPGLNFIRLLCEIWIIALSWAGAVSIIRGAFVDEG